MGEFLSGREQLGPLPDFFLSVNDHASIPVPIFHEDGLGLSVQLFLEEAD